MGVDEIDYGSLVDGAVSVTSARLAKLKEYEGCRVRLCTGVEQRCGDGMLVNVDESSLSVTLEDEGEIIVVTLDPGEWVLRVYGCQHQTTQA